MAKDQLRPRLCQMIKGENGYGFHLHGEKGKSGQFIRRVEPGSPAEAAALRPGDRVVEVNGVNVEKETHHQKSSRKRKTPCWVGFLEEVVQRIKAVEGQARLLVVDPETDTYLDSLRLTCTSDMAQRGGGPPGTGPGPGRGGGDGDLSEVWKPQPEPPGGLRRHSTGRSSQCSLKGMNGQARELRPRLCHLTKGPSGYGFNLHSEKARPGQYIRSVDPDSPASHAGLRAQDRLIEVNGFNVEGMRHSEVVSSIKAKESEARLLVVDPETDKYFKDLGIVPTEEHLKGPLPPPVTNGTTHSQLNGGSTCSSHSDLQSPDKDAEDGDAGKRDPFRESGLHLSPTAAEAKEKARAQRVNRRAPQMDWNKKREIFSNF